jgi:hypothetical protein
MVKLWKRMAVLENVILWKAMGQVCGPDESLSVVVPSWMIVDGVLPMGGGKSILAETIAVNAAQDGKRIMYALFADISNQAFKARAIS